MIGLRFGAARADLPLGRDQAGPFLPWIFALMVYVAGIGGIGLVTVFDTVHAAEQGLAATATVEVPAGASEARVQTVLALLRQTAGIASVTLLGPGETSRLLAPWFGGTGSIDALPVPSLIDLKLDPAAAVDFAALRHQLASVLPDVRLDEHQAWLEGLRRAAHRLAGILGAQIAAALALVAVAAVFAVRSNLTVNRPTIELLGLLGAPDRMIARPFAARWLRLGLAGGAIGGAGLLLTVAAGRAVGGLVQLPTPAAVPGVADWRLWLVVAGTALVAGLIAMAGAHLAVLRLLARLP